ncbi:MAG: HAMP domain-containing protein [Balneola sp.]|nr:MAG: HAMP domain-containing protein [Balneola sp.]
MKIGFPIRLKLFLLLSLLTIAVLATVLIAINTISSKTIREEVISDFSNLQEVFKIQQDSKYKRLIESAILVAENSSLKTNVELKDESNVYFNVLEFSNFAETDLIIVTDDIGNTLGWFRRQDLHGTNLSSLEYVSEALEGYYPEYNPEWPSIWAFENELYQVVSVPILNVEDIVIGTLTFGAKFTDTEAEELKLNTEIDISLFLEQDLIATSDSSFRSEHFWPFLLSYPELVDSVTSNLVLSSTLQTDVNDTEMLLAVSPLGTGENAFFIATVPVAMEFSSLQLLQENVLIIALVAFLIIILLSIFLGNLFTSPIKNLSEAMAEVSEGKFDVTVQSKTKDEIGFMANRFNEMTVGLKERFALQNYVGTHTLEMINKTSDGRLELGGSRQELAILFTDIRGSTAKIEKTDPEDFIQNLNKTLTSQADAVTAYGGSIDKFVGDSIIALFSGEDALKCAIKASLTMQKDFYKDETLSSFFKGLGIGVNFGSMVLGNMGASERMDYTVIGPEVNLCARLCSAAESGQILLPKMKIEEHGLTREFNFKDVEPKSLKGFTNPIETVEVLYE